jgi:beta-catenin-like protein 1
VEGNYEKIDKLLEIRDNATNRLKLADSEIANEKKVRRSEGAFTFLTVPQALISDGEEITSEEEDTWYLRRLESGLFTLQTVDYILAWIAMEDDGVRNLVPVRTASR